MSIVIKNIVEPRKNLSYVWQMIKNLAKDKSIDTRRDSPGQKAIDTTMKRQDPAKVLNQKIEEEKNDK